MLDLGRLVFVVVPACCSIAQVATPVAGGATAPPPAVFETWTASSDWHALPAAAAVAPTEAWQIDLTSDSDFAVQAGAVVVAEPTTNATAQVRRLDAATGEVVWQTDVGGGQDLRLVVDPGAAFVVVGAGAPGDVLVVTVLGANKGQSIWEDRGLDAVPWVQPFGPLAIIVTATESIAVNVADGTERWRVDGQITVFPGVLVVHSEPPVAGGEPMFGVIDPATGEPVWVHERPAGAIANALGDVVTLSHDESGPDDSLVGFDRATGDQLWATTVPLIGSSGAWPLGEDGALFGGSNDPDLPGSLVAVDLLTGVTTWTGTYDKAAGLAMWRHDGRQFVFIRTADHTTQVLDGASGQPAMTSSTVPGDWPLFSSGALYFQGLPMTDVTAIDMTSLDVVWTVPPEFSEYVVGVVPGGFVSADTSGIRVTLYAFLS